MTYVIAATLVLLNVGWFALVLFRLPGIWLMVLSTALVAWWQWDEKMFSIWTLAAIFILAVISEVLEFFAGAAGTRKAGGSRRAATISIAGSVIGAIIGTLVIPIPGLGALTGAIGGAALAAWLTELAIGRKMDEAVKSGTGAGAGTLAGALIKLAFGAAVWLIIAAAAFWP
ncbi:MAG: DUF456 domain-containing protein [Planctomycetota bacterium]